MEASAIKLQASEINCIITKLLFCENVIISTPQIALLCSGSYKCLLPLSEEFSLHLKQPDIHEEIISAACSDDKMFYCSVHPVIIKL